MILVPSQGLAVVSLGLSWSSSTKCPLGDYPLGHDARLPNGSKIPVPTQGLVANSRGYDDSWSSTQLWRSIGNLSNLINVTLAKEHASEDWRRGGSSPLAIQQTAGDLQLHNNLARAEATTAAATTAAAAATAFAGGGGACYASCPPMMGFGSCWNMPANTAPGNCSAVIPLAAAVCPAHGNPRQCQSPPIPEDTDCSSRNRSY